MKNMYMGKRISSEVLFELCDSLPVPGAMVFSPGVAENLANYGIDMAGVGTEITIATLINGLIGMIHGWMYDESMCSDDLGRWRHRSSHWY